MRRRYLEILILIGLVALFLCQGWKPVRSSEPIPEIEVDRREFDLNIHGVRPGMAMEQVKALYGEPKESSISSVLEFDAGPGKRVQVTFDLGERALVVSGESLHDGSTTLLRSGDRPRAWEPILGSVAPVKDYEPGDHCDWFFPDTVAVYGYKIPRHNLYIEARCEEGTIRSSPIRARLFHLSEEEMRFTSFGFYHRPEIR